jgi:hypothetical protein
MRPAFVLALGPLLLLLHALVFVLPIGLHYARLEREERARQDAMNSGPSSSAG